MPRARRCSFWENNRQCRRAGEGNPPLCEEHSQPDGTALDPIVEAVVGRVMEHPGARKVFSAAGSVLDKLGRIMDGSAATQAGLPPQDDRTGQRAQQAHRPPPPSPPRDAVLDARAVLHIPKGVTLTKALVKRQHRELAKLCHPDRGGSTEAMKWINQAAAVLEKECRA